MEQNKTLISCRRFFPHPCGRVFDAFLSPDKIKQWFGPKEFSIGEVSLSPEAGGALAIEMITPRGDKLWVRGVYKRIVPNTEIIYTFSYEPDMPGLGETMVTITFSETDGGTEVSILHTIYKSIDAAGRTKGWEDGFDKMQTLLSE